MQRLAIKLFAPALSAILLGLLMLAFRYGPSLLEESWLAQARAAHAEWTESTRLTDGQVLNARNYLSGLRQIGPAPHLPDLTGARLRIEQVSYMPPSPDRPKSIHVGYDDQAGCDISLWIAPARESGRGALQAHSGGAFSWHADGLRYVLVTSNMEYDRFLLIAKTSRAATLTRQGPAGTAHAALGFSAMISRPCAS